MYVHPPVLSSADGIQVFSGITVTKLVGISVLGLTQSKLLQVYFFRQWLALIVSGALHGLVFLPVALSFQGGQGPSLFYLRNMTDEVCQDTHWSRRMRTGS